MKFRVIEKKEYTVVHFELEGPIDPKILDELKPPRINETKGVIISGHGPIWLYCYLAHYYHTTKFIATFDPRIGAVIVESHSQEHKVGEVIKVDVT